MLKNVKGQFQRDQEEVDQIKAEETRLLAKKPWSKAGSEEACQYDIGLRMLQEQKNAVWKCLHDQATAQDRELQEGKPSIIEIMMEMDDVDTEMDTTIIEQGVLPKVRGSIEQQVYDHLVTFELNPIQWRFEALSYLVSIVKVNRQVRERGEETRAVEQAYPKIWAYLGLKNLLTRHETDTGMEDPNTSVVARFTAAEKVHRTWMGQRMRVRKPSQSPSSSRS